MPDLVDDPTYRTALAQYLVLHRDLYEEYRQAMAAAAVDRLARSLAVMRERFDEATLRQAFGDWQEVAGKISHDYIHKALVASGRVELAKRFYEVGVQVAEDQLPEDLLAALDELRRSGDLAVFESPLPHPDEQRVVD